MFNNVKLTRYFFIIFLRKNLKNFPISIETINFQVLHSGRHIARIYLQSTRRKRVTHLLKSSTIHCRRSEVCENFSTSSSNFEISRCNLTLDEYDKVTNDSCINWNIYYNECQVNIYPSLMTIAISCFIKVMQRNPFQGSVSFDNIGFAWVAIFLVRKILFTDQNQPNSLFQVISLEGWTDIMYYVQDAHSFWNWIYFVLLIVVCLQEIRLALYVFIPDRCFFHDQSMPCCYCYSVC